MKEKSVGNWLRSAGEFVFKPGVMNIVKVGSEGETEMQTKSKNLNAILTSGIRAEVALLLAMAIMAPGRFGEGMSMREILATPDGIFSLGLIGVYATDFLVTGAVGTWVNIRLGRKRN